MAFFSLKGPLWRRHTFTWITGIEKVLFSHCTFPFVTVCQLQKGRIHMFENLAELQGMPKSGEAEEPYHQLPPSPFLEL